MFEHGSNGVLFGSEHALNDLKKSSVYLLEERIVCDEFIEFVRNDDGQVVPCRKIGGYIAIGFLKRRKQFPPSFRN